MREKYIIGIDLGGTKVFTAVCNMNGYVVNKIKFSTDVSSGKDHVIQKINDSIYQVIRLSNISTEDIAAIGISSPGPLDVSRGMVLCAPMLGWDNVPLCNLLQEEFKVPVCLENDGNAAAFGELLLGAGRGCSNLIYITVSTGIGSGIIIDKKIYHGKHDAAGEFGHICIEPDGRKCDCGNYGCLEAYASGTAIARIAKELVRKEKYSKLLEISNNATENIDCIAVEKAAYEGDGLSIKIWYEAGTRLGHGISILMQILDPEIVIIGGGVSKAWKLFYEPMITSVQQKTYRHISKDMTIVPAQLGDNAGLQGAVMIAAKKCEINNNELVRCG